MLENIYRDILEHIENGENVCMVSSFTEQSGEIGTELRKKLVIDRSLNKDGNKNIDGSVAGNADKSTDKSTDISTDISTNINIDENTGEEIVRTLEAGIPQLIEEGQGRRLVEPFYPEERLIILGGGHIAIPLVEFAAKTGFHISLVDDRLSFANAGRFPLAKEVICDSFASAIQRLDIKERDYVVIITRGHRYDSDCLKAICQGPEPGYVGMIGSRRRTAIVKEILEKEGCSHERLERVHTPIGLSIGAVTPEEIAVSILAELISHKRLGQGDLKKRNNSDIDYEVLNALAEGADAPKATITVMHTDGSVPRGAGAKMIVYRDGRILGSIGGGCSEAAVTQQARQMIGSNQYQVVDIDLTGDAAEEEGMVCGGIMTVLIEAFG